MRKNNLNKGFSLIELVVVIAIMAVMAAIMVPSMTSASNESRLSADNSAMEHLAQVYKTAVQEHDNYYLFSRTIDLLDDKQVFFWYKVDEDGDVSYHAMNINYPEQATDDKKNEINGWASQLKDGTLDWVNGSYEIPKMEAKKSWGKSYVIVVSATNREYLVNVTGQWED